MWIANGLASTIGQDNPFRYRGYYYDDETGLYYLNQPYYNPKWGRFINADDYMGSTGGLLSHNVFAYCANNPVIHVDESGNIFFTIIGGLIGGIVGAVDAAINGEDIWAGAIGGAVTGAIMGAATDITVATGGVGAVAAVAIYAGCGFVGGAVGNATQQVVTSVNAGKTFEESMSNIDYAEVGVSAAVGLVSNVVGMGVGNRITNSIFKPIQSRIVNEAAQAAASEVCNFSYYGIRTAALRATLCEIGANTAISITSNYYYRHLNRNYAIQ